MKRSDYGPHFLIAMEAEAATGAESIQIDGVEAFAAWKDATYGLADAELAQLHCMLIGRSRDYKVLDDYQVVFVRDMMHGPWLIRLPDEFTRALAAIENERVSELSQRWLNESDGFQYNQVPHHWVEETLAQLVQLARQAVQQDKRMFWEAPSC